MSCGFYVAWILIFGVGKVICGDVWEGGTNYPLDGVSHTFTGLDTSQHAYFLMVQAYATDFGSNSEYVDGIYAGTTSLSSHCNPGVDTGGFYYTCVAGHDVTADVSAGSLVVSATATSDVNCCAYNGYYLYMKFTLCTPITVNLYDSYGTNYSVCQHSTCISDL
jgi:hypothetical protein